MADALQAPQFESARRIAVIVPDDGTDLRLMMSLLQDRGVTRAHSVSVRSVGALREAQTRRGHLPEAALARLVTIIVGEHDADAVFDFVCEAANVLGPGGGVVTMDRLLAATPFVLPEDVALEPAPG